MSLRNISSLKVGIIINFLEYNTTSLCLERGLDSDMKQSCRNIPGLWPNAAGAMQFFPVVKT
jgi:hypothetical protein